jgi:hypothetical protein
MMRKVYGCICDGLAIEYNTKLNHRCSIELVSLFQKKTLGTKTLTCVQLSVPVLPWSTGRHHDQSFSVVPELECRLEDQKR